MQEELEFERKRNAELVKELILQGAEVRRLTLQLELKTNHVYMLEKQVDSQQSFVEQLLDERNNIMDKLRKAYDEEEQRKRPKN
jgi:hypothetical protein